MLPILFSVMMMPPEVKTEVDGQEKVEAYQLYYHKAKGLPRGSASRIDVTGTGTPSVCRRSTTEIVWTAPPGRYTVTLAWAIQLPGGDMELNFAYKTVTVPDPCESKPKPPEPPKVMPKGPSSSEKAVGRLQIGQRGCTACAVERDAKTGQWLLVTAAHCTGGKGETGTFTLPGREPIKVRVRSVAVTSDVAVIETVDSIDELPYLELATSTPKVGQAVYHRGFGVDQPGSIELGTLTSGPTADGQLVFRLNVSSGDSGGPIISGEGNNILAVVCCTTAKEVKATVYGGGWWSIRAALDGREQTYSPGGFTPVTMPTKDSSAGFMPTASK